ncbi:TonB family protein [Methylotuvimicrobium sp.]|jgi:protein TonB|uniref:energy transducer TonB n=1 Tax=Methylotuvimicrobium sp. TaxID=2822413 RepID=UPI003D64791C
MRLVLTFTAASAINLLLFWVMIQLVTAEQGKQWIRTTDSAFFDFIRQRPEPEAISRSPRKTPPKPEPQKTETFSEQMPQQRSPAADLRALPLQVPALRVDVPASPRMNISGPTLPSVISGGQSKTGKFGTVPGSGRGSAPAAPSFIMADELTAISRIQPNYPDRLRFRRVEGEVLIEFTVTTEGTVTDPVIINSKPSGAFDRSALRAVRRWRFQPRRDEQGNPVPVRARQVFAFTLN